jgi:hypothetical protein
LCQIWVFIPYLLIGVQDFVKCLERTDIELDEFSQQVKATLQDLLRSDVMLHDVARDMLEQTSPKEEHLITVGSGTTEITLNRSCQPKSEEDNNY